MAQGSGNDLFAARIYFDLRPLAGNLALAQPLLEMLRSPAAAVPRFIKQMADIVLCNHVPLNWLGRVVTTEHQGQPMFDLKMNGTALFVDAARLWALALSLHEVGTVPRLLQAARALRVPEREAQTWVQGFVGLQRLRLHRQSMPDAGADPLERAWATWAAMSESQRDELKRALKAARLVQQRITLDYCR
jgi:CBS domain-containing protein